MFSENSTGAIVEGTASSFCTVKAVVLGPAGEAGMRLLAARRFRPSGFNDQVNLARNEGRLAKEPFGRPVEMTGVLRGCLAGAVLVACGSVACGGGGGAQTSAQSQPGGGPAPEEIPIRRLTNTEYAASVADLFPGTELPPLSFVTDVRVLGFLNISSSQSGSQVRMEQYEAAALKIAQTVTTDPTALTGCDVATLGETQCAQPYLYGLARRAYRRPLTAAEKDALWGLFLTPENGDYGSRLAMAIAGVILSPKFLFRPELGDPQQTVRPNVVALTPWETATRLAYFITGSLPDTDLSAAADANQLGTPTAVAGQARRLLGLPRSRENLVQMHEMWLRIDSAGSLARDPVKYPRFTSGLAVAMAEETHHFLQNVMFDQQGTLGDLLTAPYTFGNADVAALYGVPPPATDWGRIDLDPAKRSGLLTQPSLLATLAKDVSNEGGTPIGTSVARGKFVLEQVLCRSVPAPSPEIVAMFPPQDWTKTTRQASELHRVSAVCAGCHDTMDPLGLPFEHYDAMGQWRDTDRDMAIDATGSIVTMDANGASTTVSFDGAPALSRIVADLPESRACYVSQLFRFSTGKLNGDSDRPYIDYLATRFTSDKALVDLVVDMVASDSFRQFNTGDRQ
jgi:Protein of unknown function (DUF1592)/Protein of unknown function (DUF1588)/Protein of unknown function (DUF1587)/Protein of unknown function (DUF1595)/Protein of unknown function (DUF1585)